MNEEGVAASLLPLDVSRETCERLIKFHDLLLKWNSKINLVSRDSIAQAWSRHFLDSAQLLQYAPSTYYTWLDVGSGAGFPGAVASILAREERPRATFRLIESDRRKAAFLRAVARETGDSFVVLCERIENARPQSADVVSARALAPLNELLDVCERHLRPGGTALFLKGKSSESEIDAALENWRFRCEKYQSRTAAEAVVLKIGDIERV